MKKLNEFKQTIFFECSKLSNLQKFFLVIIPIHLALLVAFIFVIPTNNILHNCKSLVISSLILLGFHSLVFIFLIALLIKSGKDSTPDHVELRLISQDEDESKALELEEKTPPRRYSRHKTRKFLTVVVIILTLITWIIILGEMIELGVVRSETVPIVDGTANVQGLTDYVNGAKIEREPNGMIHIYADNEEDLFFAQGWACAQERLWQMEFQRRVAQGSLSEIVGPAAVETDKFFKTLGLYNSGDGYLSPEAQHIFNKYIDGVNAYIDSNPHLPFEFQVLGFKPAHFSNTDVFAWQKMMSLDLSMNFRQEISRLNLLINRGLTPERIEELWPPYPANATTAISEQDLHGKREISNLLSEEMERLHKLQKKFSSKKSETPSEKPNDFSFGILKDIEEILFSSQSKFLRNSNNWVIHGNKTATGKPLLCNDPHLILFVPSIWILFHLEAPTVQLYGASLAGVPSIIIGRNKYVTWGVTNVGTDVQDLYIIEEENATHYWHNGKLVAYEFVNQVIKVKGQSSVNLSLRKTIYGPVISDIINTAVKPISLHWVTLIDKNDTTAETFYRIARATNCQEFRDALRFYRAPAQNFVFADIYGNISYQVPGLTPIRKPGHSGKYPVSSNDSLDWQGYVPFDELPYISNPVEGFVVTANNKVVPSSYPYTILNDNDWEEPYRATRIRELILQKGNSLTIDDMVSIQLDQVSLLFTDFKPFLQNLQGLSSNAQSWRDRLLNWNGNTSPDSQEATIFEFWYIELTKLPFQETGALTWDFPQYLKKAFQDGDPNCARVGGCDNFMRDAFERVVSEHPEQTWGGNHPVVFEHILLANSPIGCLYRRERPHGGDSFTVNVGSYNAQTFEMKAGPSYRQIIDVSDWENSKFVIPMGQSGNLFSSHFEDYLDVWNDGNYLNMKTTNYDVKNTFYLKG